MNNELRVRPFRVEDKEPLLTAAAADQHQVLYPTHVVVRRNEEGKEEIVGYGSICHTPVVQVWLDSQRIKARESLHLLGVAEALAADRGASSVIMPCSKDSPFYPLMERMGYHRLGENVWFVKPV